MRESEHLVVIGGSAGAIGALRALCDSLPRNFGAPVLVTVHVPPTAPSVLPRILDRSGILSAAAAKDGEVLEPGRIYVAPADHHLRVSADGRAILDQGPHENGYRPAIDPLFRSAAKFARERAIAVVLSGGGDDGTEGALAIAASGGMVIVQDPKEATHASMPREAVRRDHPHCVLPVADIATALVELIDNEEPPAVVSIDEHRARASGIERIEPSVEATLWAAVRLFEKRAALCSNLADRSGAANRPLGAVHFESRAEEARLRAEQIRRLLQE